MQNLKSYVPKMLNYLESESDHEFLNAGGQKQVSLG